VKGRGEGEGRTESKRREKGLLRNPLQIRIKNLGPVLWNPMLPRLSPVTTPLFSKHVFNSRFKRARLWEEKDMKKE